MSKVSNVLLMLQYLENGRKYSIDELSSLLEVSPRMVRVYKDELEKTGIYVDTIMGPYGGYVLRQNFKLPVRRFDKEDYLFLRDLKIEKENSERLKEISLKVKSSCEDFNDTDLLGEEKSIYNILAKGIKEQKKVLINYKSYIHGCEDRVIRPLNLFLYNDGWGCAAFCEKRGDLRHFELKRINSIELLDEKFN